LDERGSDRQGIIKTLNMLFFGDSVDIPGSYMDLSIVYRSNSRHVKPINQLSVRAISYSLLMSDELSDDLQFLLDESLSNTEISLAFERHIMRQLCQSEVALLPKNPKGELEPEISLGWRESRVFSGFRDLVNWNVPLTVDTLLVPPPSFPILDFIIVKPSISVVYVCQVTLQNVDEKMPKNGTSYLGFFESHPIKAYLKRHKKSDWPDQDLDLIDSLQDMLKRLIRPSEPIEESSNEINSNFSESSEDSIVAFPDEIQVIYLIISGRVEFKADASFVETLDSQTFNSIRIVHGESLMSVVGDNVVEKINRKT